VTSLNLTNNFNLNLSIEDTTAPLINYTSDTPESNEIVQDNVSVYVSVNEDNFQNITFRLYNSSNSPLNSTTYTSRQYNISWNLSAGDYRYNVTVCDSVRCNSTATRNLTVLRSCMEQCSENDNCSISSNCTLNENMCSGFVCNFQNLNISAWVYTLYDSAGNGNNLSIQLTGDNLFKTGNMIIFSGKNGSLNGGVGGNAGAVNITVPNLFNTTLARFVGVGGNSSEGSGGNGGNLILNYRGLVGEIAYALGGFEYRVFLNGGTGQSSGINNSIAYNKNITCTKNIASQLRDVDINDDGQIDSQDTVIITNKSIYNSINGTSVYYNASYDISCDNKINIFELANIESNWAQR
jgi:hypothetical protein